jgi:hypothetical protein
MQLRFGIKPFGDKDKISKLTSQFVTKTDKDGEITTAKVRELFVREELGFPGKGSIFKAVGVPIIDGAVVPAAVAVSKPIPKVIPAAVVTPPPVKREAPRPVLTAAVAEIDHRRQSLELPTTDLGDDPALLRIMDFFDADDDTAWTPNAQLSFSQPSV